MFDGISHVGLVVGDQRKALDWYTSKLDFEVRMDSPFPDDPDQRWLTVGVPGQDLQVVLEPLEWGLAGDDPEEKQAVMGRQGLILTTDDCRETIEELRDRGVTVASEPMEVPWGISAIIEDLDGNTHNVLEPRPMETPPEA